MGKGGVGLLSLPDELLDRITLHVHQDSNYKTDAPTLLLCRRVSRLAQKHLYRFPTAHRNGVFDKERLDLFNQALRSRPKLRELVQQIELAPVCKRQRTTKRTAAYLDQEGVAELSSLLLRLPNVTEVTIRKFERDNLDELLYTFACMPRVSRLTVYSLPVDPKKSDQLWSRLADMPALEHLLLKIHGQSLHFPSTSTRFAGLQGLRSLNLREAVIEYDKEAMSLANIAPNLEELIVDPRSRDYDYDSDSESDGDGDGGSRSNVKDQVELRYPFFRDAPGSLSRLEFIDNAPPVLRQVLLGIDSLRRVTFGPDSKLAEAIPDLARSSVEHVGLVEGAIAGYKDIASLLEGPNRMPGLHRLSLNHVRRSSTSTAARVTELRQVLQSRRSGYHHSGEFTSSRAFSALRVASTPWPHGCSADGMDHVVDLARKAGVVVDGTAVEGLAWNRLIKTEFERIVVERIAIAQALVVECLGEARTAEVVRQTQPELVGWFGGVGKGVDEGTSSGTVA